MIEKKKALIIINAYGMGNATRCEGLMDIMADRYEFDIITSNKALKYFEGSPKIKSLFSQEEIKFHSHVAYGSAGFFIRYAGSFIPRLFRNFKFQRSVLKKNHYDLVIFDSDYSFILHRFFSRNKLIGVNNAFEVLHFFRRNKKALAPEHHSSHFIETLDYWFCKLFLHYTICPAISWKELRQVAAPRFLVCPLLVRAEVAAPTAPATRGSILVMASSSGEKSAILKIHNELKNEKNPIGAFEKNNVSSLREASSIFCNAGQSSIAECLYMNKTAVLFPIPRHAEQLANSFLAEKEGLLVYRNQSSGELTELCGKAVPKGNSNFAYSETKKIVWHLFDIIESDGAAK